MCELAEIVVAGSDYVRLLTMVAIGSDYRFTSVKAPWGFMRDAICMFNIPPPISVNIPGVGIHEVGGGQDDIIHILQSKCVRHKLLCSKCKFSV